MTNEESAIELRAAALAALQATEPSEKCAAVAHLGAVHRAGGACIDPARDFGAPQGVPGRPLRPELVDPGSVPRRRVGSTAGRIALLHALAHIEFNAINLALDAIWRFRALPHEYYADWLRVAVEEAEHFGMLEERLAAHGARYGDCVAHDGLWEMARRTAGDVLERMALVPRILEARGLDASPGVILKFRGCGDEASAQVVERILRDEVGHVAIGNCWFTRLCAERALEPLAEFRRVARLYEAPRLKPPLNLEARQRAGFSSVELSAMSRSSEWP